MSPSESERAERSDVLAVSQHWPGPRTIAVVNGKGGAGKTPTTVLLAAVFARHGGAGVLTWDNNQTRGTLGWRTEQGPHEATLLDLPRSTAS
ncbi:AAA family ATPase [Arthrobacter ulcerisalmonis]|uniref:AAA family ATPase n=1 Tax=Arthrobacter ulcerisalmonis TaxID=2483813 RepID=UPI00363AF588